MNNADQQAYPTARHVSGKGEDYYETPAIPGLTKREYFAGLAMQGMIAAITKFKFSDSDIIVHRPKDIAEISVVYADTLLKQLENQ